MHATVLRSLTWTAVAMAGVATALAAGADRHTPAEAGALAPTPRVAQAAEDNPRVEPGLVKWHASFADARAAAEKSGKPVLLFHMMGRLDRQFC